MIQCIDDMLMIKGSNKELLSELGAIVFALSKKDFPMEAITAAVASGIARSKDKNSDKYVHTILDKSIDPSKEDDKSSVDEDMLKKMFGDLFNE